MAMRVPRLCYASTAGEEAIMQQVHTALKERGLLERKTLRDVGPPSVDRQPAVLMLLFLHVGWFAVASAAPPRCEVLPLPGGRTSLRVLGEEVTCWNYGGDAPRPFLFPVNGPAGVSLVRMGHPGAPNHDHHRGVWFAHHDVEGHDFWADGTGCRIVQRQWLAYQDGPEAVAAVLLDWITADGTQLLEQRVVFAVSRDEAGNKIEVQTELRPAADREETTLGKTNFGLIAVRVAKSLSSHFGSGQLTDSEGRSGEPAIFGKRARWMDYSGAVFSGTSARRLELEEGISLFDHPANPDHPTHWHVRNDGWMGASLCMEEARTVHGERPLRLRYLLDCHRGPYDHEQAARTFRQFSESPPWMVSASSQPHVRWSVARQPVAE